MTRETKLECGTPRTLGGGGEPATYRAVRRFVYKSVSDPGFGLVNILYLVAGSRSMAREMRSSQTTRSRYIARTDFGPDC